MPSDSNRFAEVTGFRSVDHVAFFPPDSIKRESRALRKLGRTKYAEPYGLGFSAKWRRSTVRLPLLDARAALDIIMNMDEEAVLLDYRSSSSPSVVCTIWDNKGPLQYRQVATCFDEFADLIGLPAGQET